MDEGVGVEAKLKDLRMEGHAVFKGLELGEGFEGDRKGVAVGLGGGVAEHLGEQGEGIGGEAVGEVGVGESVPHEGGASAGVGEDGESGSEGGGIEAEKGLEKVAGDEGVVNEPGDDGAGVKLVDVFEMEEPLHGRRLMAKSEDTFFFKKTK